MPNAGLVTLAPSTVYLVSAPVVPASAMPAASRIAVGEMSTTAVKSRLVEFQTGRFLASSMPIVIDVAGFEATGVASTTISMT